MNRHVVASCTSSTCGLRYPAPVDDLRATVCPACESPAREAESYSPPHVHDADGRPVVRLRVVLDNVRSALNVGTMLRAADGAAVEHVHLCGVTPKGDNPKVAKTSLGAEDTVAWTHHPDATQVASGLAASGWRVWSVENTPESRPLEQALRCEPPAMLALIFGNELAGVDPALLRSSHRHLHLPMHGSKTSLNVGVALGAVVYGVRSAESWSKPG